MKGILLISHGDMAKGMINSLSMFFGENIEQLDSLSLRMDTGADEFGSQIRQKIEDLDTGDGVIIFADVLGGTPFNQAATMVSDRVDLITGMNLGMLMECLGSREYDEIDVNYLTERGKDSIVNVKSLLNRDDDVDDLDSLE